MTEEQKDLLLKDLSARLPHRIKASYYGVEEECETWDEIEGITPDGYVDIGQYSLPIECIKPYLRERRLPHHRNPYDLFPRSRKNYRRFCKIRPLSFCK